MKDFEFEPEQQVQHGPSSPLGEQHVHHHDLIEGSEFMNDELRMNDQLLPETE